MITGIDVSALKSKACTPRYRVLGEAIRTGDTKQMERLVDSLDSDVRRLSMARASSAPPSANIESIQTRTEEQQIQLKETESNEIDADLASSSPN